MLNAHVSNFTENYQISKAFYFLHFLIKLYNIGKVHTVYIFTNKSMSQREGPYFLHFCQQNYVTYQEDDRSADTSQTLSIELLSIELCNIWKVNTTFMNLSYYTNTEKTTPKPAHSRYFILSTKDTVLLVRQQKEPGREMKIDIIY